MPRLSPETAVALVEIVRAEGRFHSLAFLTAAAARAYASAVECAVLDNAREAMSQRYALSGADAQGERQARLVPADTNCTITAGDASDGRFEVTVNMDSQPSRNLWTLGKRAYLAETAAACTEPQLPAGADAKAQALADLMPKRQAFIRYARARGLDVGEQQDEWGARTFTNARVEAMWEGWFNAPAAPAPGHAPRRDSMFLVSLMPDGFIWSDGLEEQMLCQILDAYDATGSTAGASATVAIPELLFDGAAVYGELTTLMGKGHGISSTVVLATLNAAVSLLRKHGAGSAVHGEQAAQRARTALEQAEAARADTGDANRAPGDDVASCEARAATVLPEVRAALTDPAGTGKA